MAELSSPPESTSEVAAGLFRKIAVAAVLGAIIFGALAIYADVQELQRTARSFAPSAFVAGLGLAAGNYVLRIARWHYYLRRLGLHVPLMESSLTFLAGFVMSVTPGKVGEVFKSLLLYESRGTSITRTAPIVIAERLTDLLALVLLTALGALTFEHGPAVAVGGAVVVAGLLLVCAYRPLGHALLALADRLPLVSRFSHKLHEAYDALLEMTRPAPLFIGGAVAFAAWGLECLSLHVIVHGFAGASIELDASTFAYSASTLAGAVAMMPGGLGVTEVGMTALLTSLGKSGLTHPVATATTILVRIATLWFAVVIGIVALALHRSLVPRGAATTVGPGTTGSS
ncbi:MAG: flippase-like domain-containing protein [Myxococcales bacterium]|nr:flippase-like domain-containing protein [Myxococcales bacterium]